MDDVPVFSDDVAVFNKYLGAAETLALTHGDYSPYHVGANSQNDP
jgi:hypothetical protein